VAAPTWRRSRAPTWSGRVTTRRRRTGPRRRSGGWLEDVRYQGRVVGRCAGRGFAVGCSSGRQHRLGEFRSARRLLPGPSMADPQSLDRRLSAGEISDISDLGGAASALRRRLDDEPPTRRAKSPRRRSSSRFHPHRRPAADKRRETWHIAVLVDAVADRELYARGGRCRPSAGVVAGLTACLVSHRASRDADPAAPILPVFPCMVAA
jgi:hypothetical protein